MKSDLSNLRHTFRLFRLAIKIKFYRMINHYFVLVRIPPERKKFYSRMNMFNWFVLMTLSFVWLIAIQTQQFIGFLSLAFLVWLIITIYITYVNHRDAVLIFLPLTRHYWRKKETQL